MHAPSAVSPVSTESEVLSDFGIFWPVQVAFVIREPLCDLEPHLEP